MSAFGTVLDVGVFGIGNHAMLVPYARIYAAGHPTDPVKRIALLEWGRSVWIGNDVQDGGSAVSLPDVTITAGSVVTRGVSPYVVVVGDPARVVNQLKKGDVERAEPQ
ncbi:hypothetical protein IWQ60_000930 [Tieghemiomyces parasiticus]|uniref:Mannose-1-phosphate guanylyltransferase n=1 Tax=Tieghemiomyces parasiticus TaxID=78921 RepID=A0A9W8ALG4_9FUNG|nr:hypothetical protein IWQ60_000930 [Tieghemiomyces parasiticus]